MDENAGDGSGTTGARPSMWRTSRRGGWLPVAALGLAVLAMVVSGCLSGVTLTTSTLATPAIPAAEARAPNASLSDYPLLNIGAQHSTVLKGLIAEATPQQLALVESRAQAMLDKATSDPAAAVGSGLTPADGYIPDTIALTGTEVIAVAVLVGCAVTFGVGCIVALIAVEIVLLVEVLCDINAFGMCPQPTSNARNDALISAAQIIGGLYDVLESVMTSERSILSALGPDWVAFGYEAAAAAEWQLPDSTFDPNLALYQGGVYQQLGLNIVATESNVAGALNNSLQSANYLFGPGGNYGAQGIVCPLQVSSPDGLYEPQNGAPGAVTGYAPSFAAPDAYDSWTNDSGQCMQSSVSNAVNSWTGNISSVLQVPAPSQGFAVSESGQTTPGNQLVGFIAPSNGTTHLSVTDGKGINIGAGYQDGVEVEYTPLNVSSWPVWLGAGASVYVPFENDATRIVRAPATASASTGGYQASLPLSTGYVDPELGGVLDINAVDWCVPTGSYIYPNDCPVLTGVGSHYGFPVGAGTYDGEPNFGYIWLQNGYPLAWNETRLGTGQSATNPSLMDPSVPELAWGALVGAQDNRTTDSEGEVSSIEPMVCSTASPTNITVVDDQYLSGIRDPFYWGGFCGSEVEPGFIGQDITPEEGLIAGLAQAYWAFLRYLGYYSEQSVPQACLIPSITAMFPPDTPISTIEHFPLDTLLGWYVTYLHNLSQDYVPGTGAGGYGFDFCGHYVQPNSNWTLQQLNLWAKVDIYTPSTFANSEGATVFYVNNTGRNATGPVVYPLTFDPAAMHAASEAAGFNANLSGMQFSFVNGTDIPAWVASGANISSTSTTVWLKLPSIPANGTLRVVLFGTGEPGYGSTTLGLAPQLSPKYGEWDSGPSMFNTYTNFSGSNLTAGGWSPAGHWSGSQSDGLIVSSSSGCGGVVGMLPNYGYAYVQNVAVGAYVAHVTGGTSNSFNISLASSNYSYNGCYSYPLGDYGVGANGAGANTLSVQVDRGATNVGTQTWPATPKEIGLSYWAVPKYSTGLLQASAGGVPSPTVVKTSADYNEVFSEVGLGDYGAGSWNVTSLFTYLAPALGSNLSVQQKFYPAGQDPGAVGSFNDPGSWGVKNVLLWVIPSDHSITMTVGHTWEASAINPAYFIWGPVPTFLNESTNSSQNVYVKFNATHPYNLNNTTAPYTYMNQPFSVYSHVTGNSTDPNGSEYPATTNATLGPGVAVYLQACLYFDPTLDEWVNETVCHFDRQTVVSYITNYTCEILGNCHGHCLVNCGCGTSCPGVQCAGTAGLTAWYDSWIAGIVNGVAGPASGIPIIGSLACDIGWFVAVIIIVIVVAIVLLAVYLMLKLLGAVA